MAPPNSPRWNGTALFVWAVFLAAFAGAHAFVIAYGTEMPQTDDLITTHWLRADVPFDWRWIWASHNEHRIPLGKLVYLALVGWTRDFRTPTFVTLWLIGALTAGLIAGAAQLRGRASVFDVFFPLVWLSCGNAENFLNGWQVTIALDSALLIAIWLAILGAGERIGRARAAWSSAAFVAVALAGPIGWVPALPCILLALVRAFRQRADAERAARQAAWIVAAGALVTCALVVLQIVTYAPIPGHENGGWADSTLVALEFMTQSLGPGAAVFWPWSGVFVLGLVAASVFVLVRGVRGLHESRTRTASAVLLSAVLGMGMLALSVGVGRAADGPDAGLLDRYAHFSAPLVSACYLAWCVHGAEHRAARLVNALFAFGWCFVGSLAIDYGRAAGRTRVEAEQTLVADLKRGVTLEEVAQGNWERFFYSQQMLVDALDDLLSLQMGPFRDAIETRDYHPLVLIETPMLRSPLASAWGSIPLMVGRIQGAPVLYARPPTELCIARVSGARRVSGKFGIADNAWREGECDGVRFRVECGPVRGARHVLFERVLDPRANEADRGFQTLELELPEQGCELVEFTTTNLPGHDTRMDWSYWTELELR